jgi:hypothetical protein
MQHYFYSYDKYFIYFYMYNYFITANNLADETETYIRLNINIFIYLRVTYIVLDKVLFPSV